MKELLSTREAARFELVRRAVNDDDGLQRAIANALKLSAETLAVARVGIWFFERGNDRIRSRMQYELAAGRITSGDVIDLTTCPRYADALRSRRVVAADDARSDPRTSELRDYLVRHEITSMLDSPVFEQGDAVAVVCHEHVGPARVWTQQDKHFVATVSDMLGLYLEQRTAQVYYRDLLETRRALEQHRVMESLGRMATIVAHDFNNLLFAIGLKTESLATEPRSIVERDQVIAEVGAIVDQGARLARQLLDFARHEKPSTEAVDLSEVVRGLEPMLRTLERGGIELDLRIPSQPARVLVERSRAEQVVMNLAINARDALLGGGRLVVEVASGSSDLHGPDAVTLRVSDTGVGMDQSTRERIFEPFFTTKPKGKGEGLGLATVYGIVTASDGTIEVKTELGGGTEFAICWPRVGDPSTSAQL